MRLPNPLQLIDRSVVRRVFRAVGSRDPDVLRANKSSLLRMARVPSALGKLALAVAAALAWTGRTIPAVALGAAGVWLWSRGARGAAAIEAGYADFLRTPGE